MEGYRMYYEAQTFLSTVYERAAENLSDVRPLLKSQVTRDPSSSASFFPTSLEKDCSFYVFPPPPRFRHATFVSPLPLGL